MTLSPLLIEIGTEELPPGLLPRLAEDLGAGLHAALQSAQLQPGALRTFAAPRRLAVQIDAVLDLQPEQSQVRYGPPVAAALDATGAPTPAGSGFARSCGVDFEELQHVPGDKGPRLAYTLVQPGRSIGDLLPGLIMSTADALVMPRRMRWGGNDVEFVRPVHWLVVLLGSDVLPMNLWGVAADRYTRGHRFHATEPLPLADALAYEQVLEEQGHVIPDFERRRDRVATQVAAVAGELGGLVPEDGALLDEVTALVEWPVAISGGFEARFLEVPQEALVSTMCANQKYFPVFDQGGKLMPKFIAVTNLESTNPEEVRKGNERVIRPRFADAEFFFLEDRKQALSDREPALDGLAFQRKLGSMLARSSRIARLAAHLAPLCGANPEISENAGRLCKCDLLTQMVQEFPKLQGIMGRHYALLDGLDPQVASAIEEHYLPRHADDGLPLSSAGRAVALAERLDLLASFFAIGKQPTGDKDPYGLRRASLGVVRILLDAQLHCDLRTELEFAARGLPDALGNDEQAAATTDFVMQRLEAWLLTQGMRADVLQAVAAREITDVVDFVARAQAIVEFQKLPGATELAAANKRVANILAKSSAGESLSGEIQTDLLEPGSEAELHAQVLAMQAQVDPLLRERSYVPALELLAGLQPIVAAFFDNVMVNCDEIEVRLNRHRLLHQLRALFLQVADISRLQPLA